MVDHRLADLQTQWIGKHVTITNSPNAILVGMGASSGGLAIRTGSSWTHQDGHHGPDCYGEGTRD